MTSKEAFEQWLITSGYSGIAINKDDMELAYLAGRNDQKQKDAEICRTYEQDVKQSCCGEHVYDWIARELDNIAEAIINQGDE